MQLFLTVALVLLGPDLYFIYHNPLRLNLVIHLEAKSGGRGKSRGKSSVSCKGSTSEETILCSSSRVWLTSSER